MNNHILMVQPKAGLLGVFVKHTPLGLLYASADLVDSGYDVEVVDNRLNLKAWKPALTESIRNETLGVGISVSSGTPVENAQEIGALVKSFNSEIKVIWGGPHTLWNPKSILEQDPNCDYVISGYGNESFYRLMDGLRRGTLDPVEIPGLTYRNGKGILNNMRAATFEHIPYEKIPYDLIQDYGQYHQLDQQRRIFSMYSSHGCPYQCTFCSSPAQYRDIKGKKWRPVDAGYVVDHIEYVVSKYGADYIYFIDDDSFVKISHVEGILDEILKREIKIQLGFRGTYVREILRMSDEFLDKLVAAGTTILHIGAESGSQSILKFIKKTNKVGDIIEANRKLARHGKIIAAYNFLVGIPGETIDDLKMTKDLMLTLVQDNKKCVIFTPNKFRPLPGTELDDYLKKNFEHTSENSLEMWSKVENEGDYDPPWCSREVQRYCNMLVVCSYFIDNKILTMTEGKSLAMKLLIAVTMLYKPIAMLRLKYNISAFLIEFKVYRFLADFLKRRYA